MKENSQFIWKQSGGYQLHKIHTWQKTDERISGNALDYNLCFTQLIYEMLDSCVLFNQPEKIMLNMKPLYVRVLQQQ